MTKSEHDKNHYLKHRDSALKAAKEYYKRNKEKIAAYNKDYREKNKDRLIEYGKIYARKLKYNLSPEDYNLMVISQKGICACCYKSFTKTPHIDHCHNTGKVRGLVCASCNTGIGLYEKKSEFFKRYLEERG